MNGIKGKKLSGHQWNRLLDAVVTVLKYKESTIDHAIYIKVFSDVLECKEQLKLTTLTTD